MSVRRVHPKFVSCDYEPTYLGFQYGKIITDGICEEGTLERTKSLNFQNKLKTERPQDYHVFFEKMKEISIELARIEYNQPKTYIPSTHVEREQIRKVNKNRLKSSESCKCILS